MIADLLAYLRIVILRTAYRIAYPRQYIQLYGWHYYLTTWLDLLVDWALIVWGLLVIGAIILWIYIAIGG